MVLAKFRQHYPQGSLVSELVGTDRGTFIVKVSVIVNEAIIATGLAGADRVETAEDIARERAISLLMLDGQNTASQTKNGFEQQSQKETLVTSSQPSPSSKSAPPLPTTQKPDEVSHPSKVEASKTVNFSEYPTKQETPSYSVPPQQNFTPETDTEIVDNGRIIEEASEPQEVTANSANLFEGTADFTPDLVSENLSPDNEDVPSDIASTDTLEEVNFNEIKHQTDLEIKRLGWTKDDGREFLKSRYGKRSRLQLTDNQLLEFLQYLASQPSPS